MKYGRGDEWKESAGHGICPINVKEGKESNTNNKSKPKPKELYLATFSEKSHCLDQYWRDIWEEG